MLIRFLLKNTPFKYFPNMLDSSVIFKIILDLDNACYPGIIQAPMGQDISILVRTCVCSRWVRVIGEWVRTTLEVWILFVVRIYHYTLARKRLLPMAKMPSPNASQISLACSKAPGGHQSNQ